MINLGSNLKNGIFFTLTNNLILFKNVLTIIRKTSNTLVTSTIFCAYSIPTHSLTVFLFTPKVIKYRYRTFLFSLVKLYPSKNKANNLSFLVINIFCH